MERREESLVWLKSEQEFVKCQQTYTPFENMRNTNKSSKHTQRARTWSWLAHCVYAACNWHTIYAHFPCSLFIILFNFLASLGYPLPPSFTSLYTLSLCWFYWNAVKLANQNQRMKHTLKCPRVCACVSVLVGALVCLHACKNTHSRTHTPAHTWRDSKRFWR